MQTGVGEAALSPQMRGPALSVRDCRSWSGAGGAVLGTRPSAAREPPRRSRSARWAERPRRSRTRGSRARPRVRRDEAEPEQLLVSTVGPTAADEARRATRSTPRCRRPRRFRRRPWRPRTPGAPGAARCRDRDTGGHARSASSVLRKSRRMGGGGGSRRPRSSVRRGASLVGGASMPVTIGTGPPGPSGSPWSVPELHPDTSGTTPY
jgi:hypothetical protein